MIGHYPAAPNNPAQVLDTAWCEVVNCQPVLLADDHNMGIF